MNASFIAARDRRGRGFGQRATATFVENHRHSPVFLLIFVFEA